MRDDIGKSGTVRRVRFRGPAGDPLGPRLAMESLLQRTELHPPGFPSSAILVLRTFRRTLGSVGASGALGAGSADRWNSAVQADLERAWRTAARPVLGGSDPGAGAVYFADPSELLLVLMRDTVTGRAGESWWWRVLFPEAAWEAVVAEAWDRWSIHAPAAMSRAHREGWVESFLRSRSAAWVERCVRRVIDVFGLTLRGTASGPIPAAPTVRTVSGGFAAGGGPPWESWLSVDPSLPRSTQAFLALVVGLERFPAVVRSTAFARGFEAWNDESAPVTRWVERRVESE
ncbi:MAG: hypothetical protein JNL97_13870, partial [Verrucomicrobiales bacterium]|nr:hypothetical protein [Verrucomicrobiales bacterium]